VAARVMLVIEFCHFPHLCLTLATYERALEMTVTRAQCNLIIKQEKLVAQIFIIS